MALHGFQWPAMAFSGLGWREMADKANTRRDGRDAPYQAIWEWMGGVC
jgi:hypothetical protein